MSEHTATPRFEVPGARVLRERARAVTGYWWVLLAAGIAWVGAALVILQFDRASVTTVGILVGILFLAVGTVNGRLFLNNVSLGIYGDAVRQPAYRQAKLRTVLETARAVLGSSTPAPPLQLIDDRGEQHRHPAVVLVSNNPYALEPPPVAATRPNLDGAQLGILVLDAPGDGPNPPVRAWSAPALEIRASAPVHAGIDGEAVDLDPLLCFAIRPAALRVRISSRHPGVSPSGRLRRRRGTPSAREARA